MFMDTAKAVLADMARSIEQELSDAPKVDGEPMTLPSADVLRDRRDALRFALELFQE